MSGAASGVSAEVVDAWKAHVLDCGLCKNAASLSELCPIGKNFWAPTQVVREVQGNVGQGGGGQGVQGSVVGPGGGSVQALAIDSRMAAHIAQHVASRVMARASTGGAIAVPMEKTSKAISFSTAPNVVLHMPERDIEVYAEMQGLIRDLAMVAQILTNAVTSEEETKKFVRQTPALAHANESEVALVVRHTRAQFGVGSDEQLYYDFSAVAAKVLRMGDRLGNFMRVDDETRRITKAARELAVDMREVIERSVGEALVLNEETRRVVRPMRRLAIDLQGEIERRVGTP